MHAILSENLENYLDGRLSRADRTSLEAHLGACGSCREALEEARQGSVLVKALFAGEDFGSAPQPAPGFYVQVRGRIEEAKAASRWWILHPAFRQVAFASVMFVALVGGYFLTLHATELASGSAELMLDMQVERETPALLVAHRHTRPDEMCLQCWQLRQKTDVAAEDLHSKREQVMAALVSEPGD